MNWSSYHIQRLILDLVLKVTKEPFVGNTSRYQLTDADFKDDLGLDSMEIMELAAHVNAFFNIFENPQPAYLLSSTRLQDWVQMVEESLQQSTTRLSFQTSGTTGSAKIIQHELIFLERELATLQLLFPNIKEIITFVPSYTIYGFLFTIGLPQRLSIPVVFPSAVDWTKVSSSSLVVGTPFHWRLLSQSFTAASQRFSGVSAAATLDPELYAQVLKTVNLTEIYGSTETGGVGWRTNGKEAFTLFPFWDLHKQLDDFILVDQDYQRQYELMDEISLTAKNHFTVHSRKDKKVNIAGILVDLSDVCSRIEQLPNIATCKLDAKNQEGEIRLQAFIQLQSDGPAERTALNERIKQLLPAHERPSIIYLEAT